MSRRFPWKNKPTPDDLRLIQACLHPAPTSPTLFLLSEVGATQFIIQSSTPPPTPSPPALPPCKWRVSVGETQRCSCGEAKEGHSLCPHLVFVMLKVMRVKETDPLLWQLALTETEVTAVVKGRWEWRAGRRRGPREEKRTEGRGQVQRRAVEEGDVCAVCQEEMLGGGAGLGLCWCEHGCGGALHARCMRVWAEHRAETNSAITCPMCRADWSVSAEVGLTQLLQQLKVQEASPSSTTPPPASVSSKRRSRAAPPERSRRCRGCRQSIAGHHPLYRCVHCSHHLCRSCFHQHSVHSHRHPPPPDTHHHAFVLRAGPGGIGGWVVPSAGAASIPTHLMQLQSRELGAGDYDLLMQLDQHQRGQPLYAYLTAALPLIPSPAEAEGRSCAFCDADPGTGEDMRALPCGDVAHSSCLSAAAMYNADLQCIRCQQPIFPGLHSFHAPRPPQPRETKKAEAHSEVAHGSGNAVGSLGQLGVSGAQLWAGQRPAAPAEEEECKQSLTLTQLRPPPRASRPHQPERRPGHARASTVASPLPALPPIHSRSLTGPVFSPATAETPATAPSPPSQQQRRHRSQSALTFTLPPLSGSSPPSISPPSLSTPQTPALPTAGKAKANGRLHRGLVGLRGRGKGEGPAEVVGWEGVWGGSISYG